MIEARSLTRSFAGRLAVEDVSFRVPEGRLCALLGPNGAGKTTTVRLLLGLLPPSSGQAEVAGHLLPGSERTGAELRANTGLLTEAPGFYDRMSGQENLELFGRLYGLRDPELRSRGEQWLRRLELWEARDQPFGTWSKGMKQRLALIRAVLHEPPVLFLDEPTSGLDPAVAREVRDLIADFRREGRTILLCTHNLAEAEELADLVGILRRRMLAFGSPADLTAGQPRLAVQLAGSVAVDQWGGGGAAREALRSLPGVREISLDGTTLRFVVDELTRDTPVVVREVIRQGGEVLSVRPLTTSLEEVYLHAVREVLT
ncbi:MAG TPA: ABC transporter ATP-binding protein [Gemmatimonadales bacterium]|jgi:ABC-2 type transport system ATP-binding protein|nr:ABC transporter ATP-binding protein [Gemmatimonadales bacterium]